MSARQAEVLEPTAPAGADLRGLGAFPAPQVNLLPPDVTSRRKLGRTKVRLGGALVAVLLLVVVGYGYGVFMRSQASDRLALQQAEVARILDEQAKYAEVPQVKSEIGQLEVGPDARHVHGDPLEGLRAGDPGRLAR